MKNKIFLLSLLLFSCLLFLGGCTKTKFSGKQTILENEKQGMMLENLQLTFVNQKVDKQVKPPKPVGYFDYYKEINNHQYLIYEVILENQGDSEIDLNNLLIQVDINRQLSKAKLVALDKEKRYFKEKIEGKERTSGYLFTAIRKDRNNKSQTADSINFYYNKNLKNNGESTQFDIEKFIRMNMK